MSFLLNVGEKPADDDDRPGDFDGDHHRSVSEVFRERRRQTQTEEERAEGSASRRAARSDGGETQTQRRRPRDEILTDFHQQSCQINLSIPSVNTTFS